MAFSHKQPWATGHFDTCNLKTSWWNDLKFQFLYARLKNGTYYGMALSVRPSVRVSARLYAHR